VIAELVTRLISAGTPPELAAQVVCLAYAEGAGTERQSRDISDSSADRKRERDRERMRQKRDLERQSPESRDSRHSALTLKNLKDSSKKVRATKKRLSPDWKPTEAHYEAAEKLRIPRMAVDGKAEDMRIWAGSTGAVKLDWDLTFHGFLRRDAPKLAQQAGPAVMATITPESRSWNAWKSHYRDTKQNFNAGHMDKCASDGKAFTVPSEWPPGHKQEAA
jgi:hypothetical protein